MKRFVHLLLAVALAAPLAAARPVFAQAPAAAPQPDAARLDAKLAAIEKAIDEKRKELGIPGISLAIVKDDKVIYLKGIGVRNVEKNLPVTPDTLFAIGSSSKAFTGMGVVMAQDDGKLSLDDSPKKYLPYFKLQDPEADAKITVRDLLSHRSGLNRTDLGWGSGKLTSEEIIRMAGLAKPTAKLGEKFQYQNVMFLAAGEIAASVNKTTWDDLMRDRIFEPLGMKRTVTKIAEMQKSDDYALGYDYNFETKKTRHLPMRDLHAIAPAGAINSSARDMSNWVRLMLGRGVFGGKRLVSEKGYDELVAKQISMSKTAGYGLGWFVRDWNGHQVVEHGGNIDGFNALVALMPEQKLGFVLLTNVSASSLGQTAMQTIWVNIVGDPNATAAAAPAGDPKNEVGLYTLREAGFDVDVKLEGDKLTMTVPGQPTYPLENVGGRRYKLSAPAPDGFFATFRQAKESPEATEMYLEQPQGNYVLPKKVAAAAAVAATASTGSGHELVGSYNASGGKLVVEIVMKDGKPTLVVPGQPPYPLVEKAKDTYAPTGLPDSYGLLVRRAADGKIAGITLKQPQGDFSLERVTTWTPDITVDDLVAKVIAAAGGEANLRKHETRVTKVEIDFEHQGATGEGVMYAKAPGAAASNVTFVALGKKIGEARDWFDGEGGGEWVSFAPQADTYVGKRLADAKISADFREPLNWRSNFKTIEIKRKEKVGDEEVYVVVKTPEVGNPVTDYVSTKSFLVLRRDAISWSETTNSGIPITTTYSDFREVDGLTMPFKIVSNNIGMGDIVTHVKEVKHGVAIDDKVFRQ